MTEGSWKNRAACAWVSVPRLEPLPEFFPDSSLKPANNLELRAKQKCARCPVIEECLRDALAFDIQPSPMSSKPIPTEGIWGGTTAKERMATRSLSLEARVILHRNQFTEQVAKYHLGTTPPEQEQIA